MRYLYLKKKFHLDLSAIKNVHLSVYVHVTQNKRSLCTQFLKQKYQRYISIQFTSVN